MVGSNMVGSNGPRLIMTQSAGRFSSAASNFFRWERKISRFGTGTMPPFSGSGPSRSSLPYSSTAYVYRPPATARSPPGSGASAEAASRRRASAEARRRPMPASTASCRLRRRAAVIRRCPEPAGAPPAPRPPAGGPPAGRPTEGAMVMPSPRGRAPRRRAIPPAPRSESFSLRGLRGPLRSPEIWGAVFWSC